MPIVGTPTSAVDLEGLVLDGLDLNDGGVLMLLDVQFPVPRQRQEWIGAADSEHQALVRNPLHENRKITARLAVLPQADMDTALTQIATILDKLQKASKYTDGIALTWTPHDSTITCTFDVLAGEITDLPVDWQSGWMGMSPELTIELTAKPYWRGAIVTTSTASSSTPFVTLEIPNVAGDVPALGILTVTDTATQSRRHLEWGLEGPLTYNPALSLLLDSDSLVTAGFAGTGSTQTGAYDPNATGNSTVTATALTATQALCGVGNLSHVGVFRVKARVWANGPTVETRLAWRAGDGAFTTNDWAAHGGNSFWQEIDLGQITIPTATAGTQRWTGQVEIRTTSGAWFVHLDYLMLIPVSDGYGKTRATYAYTPGVLVARDGFTGTTAGAVLHGRTADAGGTWATSGATTDFVFADADGGESVRRETASDGGPRYAILGSTSFADTEVEALVRHFDPVLGTSVIELGVIARWVDSSNYLVAARTITTVSGAKTRTLELRQVVAGVATTLASAPIPTYVGGFHRLRLTAYASGRVIASDLTTGGALVASCEASSSVFATGGALASGKPGLLDRNTDSFATFRYYDDVAVATPPAEPIALYSGRTLQFRHDDTIRQDSTGVYTGRPQSYRGSRFLLPVGTSRVLVKARRNDIETSADVNVTDATQIQVSYTGRGLAVPR